MIFTAPQPFAEAIQGRQAKQLLPTTLSTEELEALGPELLELASFSAGVYDAYALQLFDDLTAKIAGGPGDDDFARRAANEGPLLLDVPSARLELKQYLQKVSYRPKPGDEGTIKDLASDARLNLKLRTDIEMAQGYGQYQGGLSPVTLDLIPCQELIRVARRKVPRNWPARWRAAGGEFYDRGRMIAAKDDPIWTKISRFGLPYAPFDFNSGMGLEGVERETAVELGVISADYQAKLEPRKLTDDLQASARQFAAVLQEALQATGYRIEQGVLVK